MGAQPDGLRPWKPSAAMDTEIREWMRARGWKVNRTGYGPRSRVYAWRHEARNRPSPTLRISRQVLEEYPPFIVVEHLSRLRAGEAIRKRPGARLVLLQRGTKVLLREVPQE